MERYENCASCNTAVDTSLKDGWKVCDDCERLSCKDCRGLFCPICKHGDGSIFDSGKYRLLKDKD
ncbi:MAG: hypothetical protein QNK37_27275 [Acidobacteriota bacterium]|nr:hypothetical protein [Acidobacteriota bacterium]